MKVEDIQIGDWVQNPLGAPYQVLAIHFYKINGDGDGYYGIHLKNKGAEARLEIYDLHPVPLTPEILEKNGFGNEMSKYLDGDEIEIELNLDDWELEDEDGFLDCCYQKPITYVHELQHALRLCGIDKEVVL